MIVAAPTVVRDGAPTRTAVARTWLGRVPAGRSDEYLAYLQETGVRDLRATPGNRSVIVLRRTVEEVTEFWVISTWDSLEPIRAFAGDPIDTARYYPSDPGFLLEMSETVEHWELFADPPTG
jgi:heme-degrading monooxygenase HmoA